MAPDYNSSNQEALGGESFNRRVRKVPACDPLQFNRHLIRTAKLHPTRRQCFAGHDAGQSSSSSQSMCFCHHQGLDSC